MVVYALGSNGSGQLGVGHRDDVSSPREHVHAQNAGSELAFGLPTKIGAGGNHTLILYSSGQLFITGNYEAHISVDTPASKEITEQTRLLASGVSDFSATWETSTICFGARSLVSYGKGDKGELGRLSPISDAKKLSGDIDIAELLFDETFIVGISSGVQHTVVVLSNGDVLGWGNGRHGQLGQPSKIVWTPRRIEGLDFKVVKAVCGRQFTYLVGDPREGRHAILGSDKWGVKAHMPASMTGWKDIGACWGSVLVLLQAGEILSWGRNDHGQLGPSALPPIAQVATGSEHTVALAENGSVLVWGWGEHGNCGLPIDEDGDVKDRWNVLAIEERPEDRIKGVGAGCATSWIWA